MAHPSMWADKDVLLRMRALLLLLHSGVVELSFLSRGLLPIQFMGNGLAWCAAG